MIREGLKYYAHQFETNNYIMLDENMIQNCIFIASQGFIGKTKVGQNK